MSFQKRLGARILSRRHRYSHRGNVGGGGRRHFRGCNRHFKGRRFRRRFINHFSWRRRVSRRGGQVLPIALPLDPPMRGGVHQGFYTFVTFSHSGDAVSPRFSPVICTRRHSRSERLLVVSSTDTHRRDDISHLTTFCRSVRSVLHLLP